MVKKLWVLPLALLLATAVGCRPKTYVLQGEVVAKDVETGEVTVKHGDIPGFMMAMTMPYRVNNAALVQELQPGDKITAEIAFGKNPSDFWLENVRITDESGRGKQKPAIATRMILPGTKVPDFTLVNQDGRTIHLSDFSGKAVLMTFLYTRCPMPDYCPRLAAQFAKVEKALKQTPDNYAKAHLLVITVDPKYDTPSVLKKYGLKYLDGDSKGFQHWDFAKAEPAELAQIAEIFGLHYEDKEGQIIHSMHIVLIAPDGTLSKFWSTDWTDQELLDSVRRAIHPPTISD